MTRGPGLALLPCLFAISVTAQAQDVATTEAGPERPVKVVLAFGLTTGGDKLAAAETYGDDTENVRAGGGVDLKAGLEWRPIPRLSFQATLGHHDDRVYNWGENVGFRRSTAELLAHLRVAPAFRLGGGLHKAYDAAFSSRIDGERTGTDYRGRLSPVVEGEVFFNRVLSLKGRYVHERFTEKATGRRVDAQHGGIYLGLYF